MCAYARHLMARAAAFAYGARHGAGVARRSKRRTSSRRNARQQAAASNAYNAAFALRQRNNYPYNNIATTRCSAASRAIADIAPDALLRVTRHNAALCSIAAHRRKYRSVCCDIFTRLTMLSCSTALQDALACLFVV